jgi:hypothetical protein
MTERRQVLGKRAAALVIAAIGVAGLVGAAAPAAAQDETQASAILAELNDSGISGTAQLIAHGQQTEVIIRANGAIGDHPTHIHEGDCRDLDPKYPLNNVELQTTDLTGSSDTTIDVPLRELLASPHLILIHQSPTMIGSYAACGDIVAGASATPAPAPNVEPQPAGPLGNTGVGTASAAAELIPSAALAGLAVICGGIGLALRRRQPRQ